VGSGNDGDDASETVGLYSDDATPRGRVRPREDDAVSDDDDDAVRAGICAGIHAGIRAGVKKFLREH
jgi:hypothetical protein